mmetsp:Transcript_85101/g.241152  ORF Transcript_85101/g.241152 Transcript_85101/m.241152 type:complete len:366 (+) Transcript_85101:71-1168(+)|eukprot:CAMPEP_0168391690 /NCGR_PEP_ID=MMETSP0228-20121227/18114_1 /TAXON_ID=133427 /ORGANISM="Protoceratium reticulatum, Strain CCCM 535 (=CCMP 1889)" /LENGTH=365 /DNA_ID=CAMNT_0008405011 /DNA_START=67 /DNA_END=1164 /DNA_ORIENTATION=+
MNAAAAPFVPRVEQQQELDPGGLSGTTVWRPRYQGRIRSFSEQKGFGFIDCPETLRAFKRDVFIHRFQMGESGLWVGQDVTFEVELNRTGCPQARSVQPLDPDPWALSQEQGFLGTQGCGGPKGGPVARQAVGPHGGDDGNGAGEPIEDMLRGCTGSASMWEIIERHGHSFGKKHVVIALYQLGLCRQYERRAMHASLTSALVDRLVLFQPGDLTASEASHVLWAIAILEEVRGHARAHAFVVGLAQEAMRRVHEFSPSQMANSVAALSRLVRTPEEDKLVGQLTTQFSDFALGNGQLPRFPPEELRVWTAFLQEAAGARQPGRPCWGKGERGEKGGPWVDSAEGPMPCWGKGKGKGKDKGKGKA